MSDVVDAIISRRSVRSFSDKEISDDILNRVLTAGLYAPSAQNRQPSIIICVRDEKTISFLEHLNRQVLLGMGRHVENPFFGSKTLIIVLARRDVPTYIEDGTLVMSNILLAAHSEGLGACWINRAKEVFDMDEGKKLLNEWGIEGEYAGIGHIILGYPNKVEFTEKKIKEGLIHYI